MSIQSGRCVKEVYFEPCISSCSRFCSSMISLLGSIWAAAGPEMESSIGTVIQAPLGAVLPVHGVTGLFLTRQIVSFTLIIICRSLRFESEHWIGLSFHSFEW